MAQLIHLQPFIRIIKEMKITGPVGLIPNLMQPGQRPTVQQQRGSGSSFFSETNGIFMRKQMDKKGIKYKKNKKR
jgi:hypothetical protein